VATNLESLYYHTQVLRHVSFNKEDAMQVIGHYGYCKHLDFRITLAYRLPVSLYLKTQLSEFNSWPIGRIFSSIGIANKPAQKLSTPLNHQGDKINAA
ncbi:MAG: hypothetical protein II087_04185, partial [Muribaculaceae bacterium]|nr:hypothetical protein [Muribaculaceae bacterium]